MYPVRRQVITIGCTRSWIGSIRYTISYDTLACYRRVTRVEKKTLAGFFELEDPAVATTVIRRTRAVSFSPWSSKKLLENVLRLVVGRARKIA